ncbi:MAG TPA: hypothetical protein VJI98_00050 [Candidatus Nanoarchaeia archaeon]|nr:hypothetical protein [Candidatus Nanoarchaeia archaeon]
MQSIPVAAFFASYPPCNELRQSFVPSPEKFGEEYDLKKIETLQQALYIELVGNSVAIPTHKFKVVGKEAVASLLKERNATSGDLSGILENSYVIFTDYSRSSGLVVGLRAK